MFPAGPTSSLSKLKSEADLRIQYAASALLTNLPSHALPFLVSTPDVKLWALWQYRSCWLTLWTINTIPPLTTLTPKEIMLAAATGWRNSNSRLVTPLFSLQDGGKQQENCYKQLIFGQG